MKTIITLLPYYFAINCFISGYLYKDGTTWTKNNKEVAVEIITAVFMVFFALVFYLCLTIWMILYEGIYKNLNNYFQIYFWLTFTFTRRWNNLSVDKLNNINKISSLKIKDTIKNRIYRYCTKLINKRNNNFVYNPPK